MKQALYNKYRPETFDEMYGQEHVKQCLQNQIKHNLVAHSYMFCGPKGTGKTTVARIFARGINCSNHINGNPCCKCESCLNSINKINTDIIEIDAASNSGVDNIRELIEQAMYKPSISRYKVYIIDECHMLSTSAFNALLKILEEPPEHLVIILATTEEHKVIPTISSRCQKYRFTVTEQGDMLNMLQSVLLKEGFTWDIQALRHISSLSSGGMRDALSILETCMNSSKDNKITYELVSDILGTIEDDDISELNSLIESSDISSILNKINLIYMSGKPMIAFCESLYRFYRDRIVSGKYKDKDLEYQRYMRILGELMAKLKSSTEKLHLTEISLIKMCTPQMEESYDSLVRRIEYLEHRLDNGLVTVNDKNNDLVENFVRTIRHRKYKTTNIYGG